MNEAELILQALRAVYLNRVPFSLLSGSPPELPDHLNRDCLRSLVEEGLVAEVPGNSHYHLSYEGMCEYSRLTYRQITGMLESYYQIRQKLRNEFANLAAQGIRRIAFYGTGMVAEAGHGALCGLPLTLAAVVSDHRNPVNFYQFKLEPPEILPEIGAEMILLCSYQPRSEMVERLGRLGIAEDRLLSVGPNWEPTSR